MKIPRPQVRFGLALAAALAILAVVLGADLAPRVQSDFFFASDDPQLASNREIDRLFPSAPQMLVQLAPVETPGPDPLLEPLLDPGYLEVVDGLSSSLGEIPGVARVASLTAGPASAAAALEGPFWSRLLVAPDRSASLVLVELAPPEASGRSEREVVTEIERQVEGRQEGSAVEARLSGIPFVLEQIRRQLVRDFKIFTLAAVLIFGLAVAGLFRSWRVLLGTLVSGSLAATATLALLQAFGIPIGILTANIATLVFVLTLSHIVFVTAGGRSALRTTRRASFWCATTTFLGFCSLLLASAKPLRDLGVAGAVGTGLAFAAAFLVYPPFLPASLGSSDSDQGRSLEGRFRGGPPWLIPALLALVVGVSAVGLPRLQTDASLLSYFAPGSELREGLDAMDRRGGSSPLSLVVEDPAGASLDTEEALARLEVLHRDLEQDPEVGTVLSPWALVAEARRVPLASFFSAPQLVDLLASPQFDRVASTVYTEDRLRARVLLRMKEGGREDRSDRSRGAVVERLVAKVRTAGLEPALVGGLYDLQGQLARLVASSLAVGLGGLFLLFTGIALRVSGSGRGAAVMVGSLAAVLVVVLGSFGLLGRPLDIIASPAANLALAVGVDSMIHLSMAARRRGWAEARRRMALPILGATGILAAGFGIFLLSSFPPTRSFGLAVVVGSLTAAAMALFVLPLVGAGRTET